MPFYKIKKVYLGNRMPLKERKKIATYCRKNNIEYVGLERQPNSYNLVECKGDCCNLAKNKNGEVIYGYKCYNQLNYGSKDIRIEAGIDDSKSCNLREICDWKLEMMARHIFAGLWGNKKDILNI